MDNAGLSPLRGLAKLRDAKTRRFSSYDRTGGNDDRLHIEPGKTVTIAEHDGAGIVTHIWATLACKSESFLRKIVLRAYWDGEEHPSIETPVGDFFGMGHARTRNFASLPVQASPEDGKAFNCYFPMPFASHMKLTITNEAEDDLLFYYYVDLELHDALEEGLGRFHAQYRQDRPPASDEAGLANEQFLFGGENTDGKANYTILDAEGRGHYVGVLFSVYSRRRAGVWDWYGEGDDMIFVDGEPGLSVPDTVRKPDPRIGPKAALIADRRRKQSGRQRCLAADTARHRHGGLFQHGVVPDPGPQRALSRHHRGRRAQLDRAGDALPLAYRGPGDLPEADPGDHRAWPRQPSLGRYLVGRLLVPGRAAQAVRETGRRERPHSDVPGAVPQLGSGT